jgi:DNA-binding IclR family transcriptional regulator
MVRALQRMSTSGKMLLILDLFDVAHPHWSVEEAATTLGLATSTAYRHFAGLSTAGLIAPSSSGRYVLGPAIVRYDRQLRLTDPLISAADGEMRRLSRMKPGRTVVFICRLLGGQVMCVHQAAAGDPAFAVGYERGRPMPLVAGSASKAILAHLPPRQLRSLYDRLGRSEAIGLGESWEDFRDGLRAIRSAGYVQSESEIDEGMRGISVPIVDPANSIVASLSIAGPVAQITAAEADRLREELRVAVERVRARLAATGIASRGEVLPVTAR